MIKCLITSPLLFLLWQGSALGQQARPDTLFLTAARQYQQSLYDASIRGQSRLYNGTEYRDYLAQGDENPYFGVDDWQYGYVYYDDVRYDSVAMFYDLSRDQVITEHMLTGAKIELIAKKISSFQISQHTFDRLYRDSSGVISEGFYERLYKGNTAVYVKRTKTLSSRASGNELTYNFDERNRVYLLKDNRYYPVKSKKSVLAVFSDKKPELKAMLKEQKLKFKTDRERAIVRMAQTYDSTPH